MGNRHCYPKPVWTLKSSRLWRWSTSAAQNKRRTLISLNPSESESEEVPDKKENGSELIELLQRPAIQCGGIPPESPEKDQVNVSTRAEENNPMPVINPETQEPTESNVSLGTLNSPRPSSTKAGTTNLVASSSSTFSSLDVKGNVQWNPNEDSDFNLRLNGRLNGSSVKKEFSAPRFPQFSPPQRKNDVQQDPCSVYMSKIYGPPMQEQYGPTQRSQPRYGNEPIQRSYVPPFVADNRPVDIEFCPIEAFACKLDPCTTPVILKINRDCCSKCAVNMPAILKATQRYPSFSFVLVEIRVKGQNSPSSISYSVIQNGLVVGKKESVDQRDLNQAFAYFTSKISCCNA